MYFKVLFCLFATAVRLLLFRTSILHYLTYDPFVLSLLCFFSDGGTKFPSCNVILPVCTQSFLKVFYTEWNYKTPPPKDTFS